MTDVLFARLPVNVDGVIRGKPGRFFFLCVCVCACMFAGCVWLTRIFHFGLGTSPPSEPFFFGTYIYDEKGERECGKKINLQIS